VRHASREANLLGASALAVADRLRTGAGDAALVALGSFMDGSTIDALAKVLALTHSGAVRLVDRLADGGLVERRSGPDARSVAVHLTADGAARAERLRAEREAMLLGMLDHLDPAEREALAPLLGKLLGGLTTDRASARRICRLCDADACGHPEHCPVTRAVGPS